MTQCETLFEMPADGELFDTRSLTVERASEYALEAPSPGVCHACSRAVPEGFTDACRACRLKSCEAQQMEEM